MKRIAVLVLIMILACCVSISACGSSSNDGPKETIAVADGYDKLQSLYLQIDDTYSEEKLEKIVEDNGLFMETDSSALILDTIWISETETTGRGPGGETYYEFDSDFIRLSLSDSDKDDDDVTSYVFNKEYCLSDDSFYVEYSFYDDDVCTVKNMREENHDWASIEEALDYVLSQKSQE